MSKSANGLGQFSGKLGGVVFSVVNGQQIERAYQPVVSNPKSTLQRFQRAKGNLVGQVSKITPYQVLTGLGSNRRARRSRFLRLLLQKTTAGYAAGSVTEVNAKLAKEDFVFAEGAIVPTANATALTTAAQYCDYVLTRRNGVSDDEFNASGFLVVVTLLSASGIIEEVMYRFVSSSEFTGNTFSGEFVHTNEGAYSAAIYVATYKTTDGSSLRARAEELFGEGSDFAANMVYNPAALPVVWSKSQYYRESAYTPAAKSDAAKSVSKNK